MQRGLRLLGLLLFVVGAACEADSPSVDEPTDSGVAEDGSQHKSACSDGYEARNYYVTDTGNDANSGASETLALATIMEAQQRADAFVHDTLVDPNPCSMIKVRIYMGGDFHGQWFRWRHAYRHVVLEFRNIPGRTARFFGDNHPCYDLPCRVDAAEPSVGLPPTFDPVGISDCVQDPNTVGDDCLSGYTFFATVGGSWWYQGSRPRIHPVTGFGPMLIQGIQVIDYHKGLFLEGLRALGEDGLHGLKVELCQFIRNGEIAHNPPFTNSESAIYLRYSRGAIVRNNVFQDAVNYGSPWLAHKILMHGLYLHMADETCIAQNSFTNVSGQPIKFRNGSDRNLVRSNTFTSAGDSTSDAAVQDWYSRWQYSDTEPLPGDELPSFGNVVRSNTYVGYTSNLLDEHPDVIAIACPYSISDGDAYAVAGSAFGQQRMTVDQHMYYCKPGPHARTELNRVAVARVLLGALPPDPPGVTCP